MMFTAKIGDILRWDAQSCSVLLVHAGDNAEAVAFLRKNRDAIVQVTVELAKTKEVK